MAADTTKREVLMRLQIAKDISPPTSANMLRRSFRQKEKVKYLENCHDDGAEDNPKKKEREADNGRSKKGNISKNNSDKGSQDEHTYDGELSAYELERLENIRRNNAFLASINLLQAAEEVKQSTSRKASRGLMSSKRPKREMLPPRKSLRLQNKEASLPPEPQEMVVTGEPVSECSITESDLIQSYPSKKPSGPLPMQPVNMEEGSKLPTVLVNLCSADSVMEEKVDLNLNQYRSSLNSVSITEDRVAKVVKGRIFSAAFHPCTSSLLMAAGDMGGCVGLWNLGGGWGDDGVLLFEPHSRPVSCMAASTANSAHLLSCSYDGSLRCMDLEKALFNDVYNIQEGLKSFDFLSTDCSTLVVGDWYGDVAIVDRRTKGNSHESLNSLDQRGVIRSVSVHPLHRQYFAVAESRAVNIYDSRCLGKTSSQAVSQLSGHTLSISSAYFSPQTGNRVLTTCMDNTLRIYDTSTVASDAPLLKSIRQDMGTGRWLTRLSAVWDPKREDCFLVGSMAKPRRMQVFHESGELLHSLRDADCLTTVLSVTAFHPARNALFGGNSSGRLHLFTD